MAFEREDGAPLLGEDKYADAAAPEGSGASGGGGVGSSTDEGARGGGRSGAAELVGRESALMNASWC